MGQPSSASSPRGSAEWCDLLRSPLWWAGLVVCLCCWCRWLVLPVLVVWSLLWGVQAVHFGGLAGAFPFRGLVLVLFALGCCLSAYGLMGGCPVSCVCVRVARARDLASVASVSGCSTCCSAISSSVVHGGDKHAHGYCRMLLTIA